MFRNSSYFVDLGMNYYDSGEYEKAIKAYKKAIRKNPDEDLAHFGLGLTYTKLRKRQEANGAYKQASKINSLWEGHASFMKDLDKE